MPGATFSGATRDSARIRDSGLIHCNGWRAPYRCLAYNGRQSSFVPGEFARVETVMPRRNPPRHQLTRCSLSGGGEDPLGVRAVLRLGLSVYGSGGIAVVRHARAEGIQQASLSGRQPCSVRCPRLHSSDPMRQVLKLLIRQVREFLLAVHPTCTLAQSAAEE
jgi:hypothetical protein